MEENIKFQLIDYGVLAFLLFVSIAISVYVSIKGSKSSEHFLMGNRSFHFIPVAVSVIITFISSVALLGEISNNNKIDNIIIAILLGFSGEVYMHGIQYSFMVSGLFFAMLVVNYVNLPVFMSSGVTSVNEV